MTLSRISDGRLLPRLQPRLLLVGWVLLCAGFPSLLQAQTAAGGDRLLDRIVVVVGEDVITQRELVTRLQATEQELRQRGIPVPSRDTLLRQLMELLITERIQLQEAEQIGIRIDELTLDRTIEGIAAENGLSLLELRRALQQDGMEFATFRQQIRQELAIQQLRRRQVEARLRISDQEIDDLIAAESGAIDRDIRYQISHLLIALPAGADASTIENARVRAQTLSERLRAGADIADLAIQHSDAPDALQGGDMGWRRGADLPTLYARQVILMRPGDISPVLRSTNGFHILQLRNREAGEDLRLRQTQARHILISPNEIRSDAEAQELAESLYRRIQAGDSFAEMARVHSNDPGSAALGGALGWVNPGVTVPEFEAAMETLAIGAMSPPVRSDFGWHIIEVLDRRDMDATQDLLRARAREILQNRKREEETERWLRRLRDTTYIDFRIEGFDS